MMPAVWWSVGMSFAVCSGACPGSVIAPWIKHFGEVGAGRGGELFRERSGCLKFLHPNFFRDMIWWRRYAARAGGLGRVDFRMGPRRMGNAAKGLILLANNAL
jgi:hypothetical protein